MYDTYRTTGRQVQQLFSDRDSLKSISIMRSSYKSFPSGRSYRQSKMEAKALICPSKMNKNNENKNAPYSSDRNNNNKAERCTKNENHQFINAAVVLMN